MVMPAVEYPADPDSDQQSAQMATPTFLDDDMPPIERLPMTHA